MRLKQGGFSQSRLSAPAPPCALLLDHVIAPTRSCGVASSVQDRCCVRQEMFSTDHTSRSEL